MKRAVVQAKVVVPVRHPSSGQVVGQKEETSLRVFDLDTTLDQLQVWLTSKGEDAAHLTVNFETEDPDEIKLIK